MTGAVAVLSDIGLEEESLGPAMLACNAQQRKFVRALIALGVKDKATAAVKVAGYGGPKATHNSLKQQAYYLMHSPRVQAAIHEECVKQLGAGKAIAMAGLMAIASDPSHPNHFAAINSVLDRAGLGAKTEHKMTVEHVENPAQQVERIVALAKELGLDPKALLGRHGVVIEGEATEASADVA